jgi:hypothetical protein
MIPEEMRAAINTEKVDILFPQQNHTFGKSDRMCWILWERQLLC